LQKSAILHRIVLKQINKITVTGIEKQTSRLDLVKKSVDVLKLE